jgi:hypothetical protein
MFGFILFIRLVAQILSENGLTASAALSTRTVRGVVKEITNYLTSLQAHEHVRTLSQGGSSSTSVLPSYNELYAAAAVRVIDVLKSCDRVRSDIGYVSGSGSIGNSERGCHIHCDDSVNVSTLSIDTPISFPSTRTDAPSAASSTIDLSNVCFRYVLSANKSLFV